MINKNVLIDRVSAICPEIFYEENIEKLKMETKDEYFNFNQMISIYIGKMAFEKIKTEDYIYFKMNKDLIESYDNNSFNRKGNKISNINLVRLMVLAYHINHFNLDDNLIGYRNDDGDITPITPDDMIETFMLKTITGVNNFLKQTQPIEVIKNQNDKFYLNKDYFRKIKDKPNNDDYCKLNLNHIICTFYKGNIQAHHALSYYIRLIPYVNRTTNILCFNPEEKDITKIQPLILEDVIDILNIGRYPKSIYFFKKKLFGSIMLENDTISNIMTLIGDRYLAINPNFVCFENDIKYANEISKYCEIRYKIICKKD